jgi:hypothetical protein
MGTRIQVHLAVDLTVDDPLSVGFLWDRLASGSAFITSTSLTLNVLEWPKIRPNISPASSARTPSSQKTLIAEQLPRNE